MIASWRRTLPLCVALGLASGGCTDHKKRLEEVTKQREAEKKAWAKDKEAKEKAAIVKIEPAKLDPYWDAPTFLKVTTGRPCPEGLWSIFQGTPGEGAEKAANEARRAELAAKMRQSTFVTVLPHEQGTGLRKYSPKKKSITVEVEGLVECYDGLGLISLAWGEPAKPFRPPTKTDEDDDDAPLTPQAVWRAQPILFPLPFATAAEAKAFTLKEGLGIETRLVYTLGKVDIDKKKLKTSKPLPDGGGIDENLDWGAGRLVHVDLVGVRIATDHEKAQLLEQKKK